jgi:hypothetical protein
MGGQLLAPAFSFLGMVCLYHCTGGWMVTTTNLKSLQERTISTLCWKSAIKTDYFMSFYHSHKEEGRL